MHQETREGRTQKQGPFIKAMRRKTYHEELRPLGEHSGSAEEAVAEWTFPLFPTLANFHRHLSKASREARLAVVTSLFRNLAQSRNPGNYPGIFFDSCRLNANTLTASNEALRRLAVAHEKTIDSFHDSESEDIYDLYNACNGIVRNGLLDIRELDKLSQTESEALNVPRLREIWEHTTSGCCTCKDIVSALNLIRGTLADEILDEDDLDVDLSVLDSPSW